MGFIIYAMQRSGTQMLTTAIDSHSKLRAMAELRYHLDRTPQQVFDSVYPSERSPDLAISSPTDPVTNWISLMGDHEGANVKYGDINENVIKLNPSTTKIIHLVRLNVFDTAVSCCLNNSKKQWGGNAHIYKKKEEYSLNATMVYAAHNATKEFHEKNRPKSAFIPPNHVKYMMDKIVKSIATAHTSLKPYGQNVLTVTYEDLTSNEHEAHEINPEVGKQICDFLSVPYEKLCPATLRVNFIKNEDYIENYDEIRSLKRTIPRELIF